MARAVLTAFLIALVLTCAPLTPTERLLRMAEQTRVCVDNPTMHGMRVEILDSRTRHEFGEVHVRSGERTCEWMYLPEKPLDARIKAVSVRYDVVPPAWAGMLPGHGQMVLVAGADGLTPFAHSHRRR